MQNATSTQGQGTPQGSDLGSQIRQQVQEQIRQAQQQAQAARDQAHAARDQAQAARDMARDQGNPVVLVPPAPFQPEIPPQAVDLALAFFIMIAVIAVGLPIARAIGRRIERKPVPQPVDPALASQLQRIEQAVDAMSIEVERISEAQRYMARLQSEREAVPRAIPNK